MDQKTNSVREQFNERLYAEHASMVVGVDVVDVPVGLPPLLDVGELEVLLEKTVLDCVEFFGPSPSAIDAAPGATPAGACGTKEKWLV